MQSQSAGAAAPACYHFLIMCKYGTYWKVDPWAFDPTQPPETAVPLPPQYALPVAPAMAVPSRVHIRE
jgi:hypothetical protein